MHLGIIGLPFSGKTTIFIALTDGDLPPDIKSGTGRIEVRTAVVDVPDPRLDALSALMKPRKTTYSKVTYADVGGYTVDSGLSGALANQLVQMDGLIHVVRAFEDPTAPHPMGSVDVKRDISTMESEFLLYDMLTVERRLERLAEERQKGVRDRAILDREIALFERLSAHLDEQAPLRDLALRLEQKQVLAGYGLLTDKPLLIVINLDESSPRVEMDAPGERVHVLNFYGKLEMEIAQLQADEALTFLEEYGISEPARERVVRASYHLLGLQSFFTINEREARAWTLPRNGTALEAAGMVHSDMARGFIRAEVIGCQELLELGGLAQARAEGKLRLEGKDYVVQDGDVIYIRFNI
ncbi:MAG: redox-regulated ATPase YchF [Anaerolineales bacterium]|nr:redox-regulated ATPase YchF [Anaerolineales bacterium]